MVRVNETQLPLAALLEDTVDGPYTAASVVLNDVDPEKDDDVVVVWPMRNLVTSELHVAALFKLTVVMVAGNESDAKSDGR